VSITKSEVRRVVGEAAWVRLKLALGRRPPAGPTGLRSTGPLPAALNGLDLSTWAWHFGTDKWGEHWYTPHYERHFAPLRRKRLTLLEIGVGGYDRSEGGESLRMWEQWFPRARILGLDIEDKTELSRGRVTVYQGNQVDEGVLRRIIDEHGPLRVVIDDGSHNPAHVRQTFETLFPLLPDGALYAIEDTQTSYWPTWGGSLDLADPSATIPWVKDLVDGLHYEEQLDPGRISSWTDEMVRAVHCYHNLVIIEKGDNREGSSADRLAAGP